MSRIDELLNQAMLLLAEQPGAIFLGQNVRYPGTVMYGHLEGVQEARRIEFPVAEELQLGVSTGLAIQGFLPVSIFPRMDFLLRALDQLVNHLDKLEFMSVGQFNPKVIIRTRVGSIKPLNAGPQHTQRHTESFRKMLTNVDVYELRTAEEIMPVYEETLASCRSSLIVEAFGCS